MNNLMITLPDLVKKKSKKDAMLLFLIVAFMSNSKKSLHLNCCKAFPGSSWFW